VLVELVDTGSPPRQDHAVGADGDIAGPRLDYRRHRMPGVTTKELMARIGHASPRAALRYQHATAERDRAIAAFLDEQINAEHRDKHAPIMPLPNSTRAAGAGSEP
jgi:hypothetical protein